MRLRRFITLSSSQPMKKKMEVRDADCNWHDFVEERKT
jgi:hypothetical protein